MSELVVVSLEPWDDVWRRNQYLVDGLLRGDPALRVLFVEPAADPLHDLTARRRPERARSVRPVGDTGRLWTMRPLKALPRRLDPRADARLAHRIARAARGLGFRVPALWINDPGQAALADVTGWPTLYDITDDWLAADRPPRERERLQSGEDALLAHAAEVVACSPELVRRKSGGRGPDRRPVTLIRNAVDMAAYRRPVSRPADLPAGRTAVYVGTLHTDRLDVDLCARTADALGDAGTMVLVGPDALDPAASDRLRAAGVALLGARSRDDVVGYLRHADVLTVPHVVDTFTDSLDPIKLYEYQAAGRPVVSTPVAGFRDAADPRITIAEGPAFIDAVEVALRIPRTSDAASVPGVADWSDRVREMAAVLDRLHR
jgi:teichuronic acid biosynthesis glycosyltransferase TuaH